MSRKAKMPISLPKGSEVSVTDRVVSVKGPKGSVSQEIGPQVLVNIESDAIVVTLHPDFKQASNFHGLYWALISNMVCGVNEGFSKKLEMIGVGYRAQVSGDKLDLLIGVSHPVKMPIPVGLKVTIEKNTLITITGIDKQKVGQFAADIRAKRPPEPYKGKGIRYVDEYVRRKAGKTAKK